MSQIEKRISEIEQTIEEGWKALRKRSSQFGQFDLTCKAKKRQLALNVIDTFSKKIRDLFGQAI